ncbi:hypothetical protein DLJ59_23510 [Micromonospora inaquosa]|uniref:Uncharacterized protein n=1 Tax=Micromonospora inaquosa TaxID=2203716 RepID=A0A3N9WGA4_9ACTN|nr:hypothetical protein DLJ59_23510 [Micromonospora inaquosa]
MLAGTSRLLWTISFSSTWFPVPVNSGCCRHTAAAWWVAGDSNPEPFDPTRRRKRTHHRASGEQTHYSVECSIQLS